jgi:DNA polymerase-4
MGQMQRKIIHIDMDAFYASVEVRNNPSLKGKPLVVGGFPSERGVVSTASYEARKYGIKSAMATSLAMKLCPDLIVLHPNFKEYKHISQTLVGFYREFTDLVEPLSLDECYLDVTTDKQNIGVATNIGRLLMARIKNELNLTASVGVAPNKLLAKIASDINKPDGMFVIKPVQVADFMTDLEVKKIWGVGKVTQKNLNLLGITTCGELQTLSEIDLIRHFGKFGETLYYFARGIDESPVVPDYDIKSIGSEQTFPFDTDELYYLKEALRNEVIVVSTRLEENGLCGKTITLKVKFADFKRITRSMTLEHYTDYTEEIFDVCLNLLKNTGIDKKIRLIGLAVSNLADKETVKKNLFDGI